MDGERLAGAARNGDTAEVARLLAAGADADAPDAERRTALDRAVNAGHARVVELLLRAGADPGRPIGAYGGDQTPLTAAVGWGHADVVRLLLAAGAPTGPQTRFGWVPLVHAATGTHGDPLALVDLLLEHGADLEERQRDMTPLEWACGLPRPDVVRRLLARGAVPTLEARDRAVHWGARRNPERVAVFREIVAALAASAAAR
ncbi:MULTISPECIES: ankyrin repeat domain-containing protein [Streptomyces]|uniref:Ankyrin repeat domain-containing protein n=2 Tax=Streptomyces TaxID=1883 RepID=A0ABU4K403_9ACTN|nr:ankyrin repeat domain-containing protein [Streptomyces roseolus]MDX2292467.1 ankyrin repeat domain-containing protein [Streptomyces roseolus]